MANKNIAKALADVQDGFGTLWFDAVYTLHDALARNVGSREKATAPLETYDDSTSSDKANQKNDNSDVRNEDGSLDPAVMVKQEMEIGPTMLQPPDIKYTPNKPGPEDESETRSRRLWQDKINKTLIKSKVKPKTCIIQHICDICNKSFSRRSDLKRHMLNLNTHSGDKNSSHTGERKNPCEVCNKTFTDKSHLRTHMLIHSGKRESKCEVCNKTFTHKSHLKTHILIHTGERENQCDICKKTFTQKSHLRTHMLIHTGERENLCNVCNKSFTQKAHLKRHMLIHTVSGREFRCNMCPKAFYTQVVLNSHRMSHSEHRPFKCDVCEKAFKVKAALARHSLVHSGEKPYMCNMCGLAFTTRHWTQLHVRKVHNSEHIPYKQWRFPRYNLQMANKEIINSTSEVQDGLGTSWFDAVYNLHTALARNVGSLEPATDPLETNNDSTSSDKANQKDDDFDIHDEDSPLDPAAIVKQEMDVGPTMLHPPEIKYTSNKPARKNNSQIKSRRRRPEKKVTTLKEENADKPNKCRIQHVCDICNKSFSRKSDLRKHILSPRTHISKKLGPTGERINQCEVCNKIFRQTGHLTTHMLIHTAVEREFRCNLCPKAFYTRVVLNSHRMSHSEYRPFKCNVCEKAFKVKSALARHSLVHSGEKPFVCNVCGLAFTTRHWTQLHVRKVHNNEHIPYKPRVRNLKGRATRPRDTTARADTLSHSAEPM